MTYEKVTVEASSMSYENLIYEKKDDKIDLLERQWVAGGY